MVLPRIVSLFSGAGGLDLGFHLEGYEIAFAVDRMAAAVQTHKRNFPATMSVAADITIRNEASGSLAVLDEIAKALKDGEAIGIIGGPPCQGFSRANSNSRADDPRNQMPTFYLEIVEALQTRYDVQFVLFENVMGIRDAKHSVTFRGILARLKELELTASVADHSALDYGVPQTRNRVIISGFKHEAAASSFKPKTISREEVDLTVRGAIGHLPQPVFFSRSLSADDIPTHPNHWTMTPRSKRFNGETAGPAPTRSFRRLSWDKPSPTVAYGHREIHIHPDGARRLSIYEAMLLQGFPRSFVLEGTLSQQVEQVSNAVPPPVARSLAAATSTALTTSASAAQTVAA
ncbi:DNA cytosine methyltransferase [Microbacterium arabinogalactanolyticum]|uniref:DNA (cytosine-5-)-methyltransferase n=1 Tax=Microbacterium arabinogalactanolyticum TaxID=69365 RepID=A0ABQ5NEL6_9MICO|nr:DNA cytosine methyltransferase [Microbacterium arabinogalactanolyticum]GLC84134.1 cytosine-specific methyltransferase [Microbacterium arabinogalactanolyticum]